MKYPLFLWSQEVIIHKLKPELYFYCREMAVSI
jgi:hypothetical protein